MPRSKAELQSLFTDFRRWYLEAFGEPYDFNLLGTPVTQLLLERRRTFVFKRLGHLPDDDLVRFMKEMLEFERRLDDSRFQQIPEPLKPEPVKEPVKEIAPVAKYSDRKAEAKQNKNRR